MDKKKVIDESAKIFWIFMIGSILGYIFEMIVVLVQKGHFESRQGVIYGPFTPVYGIGGIMYYIAFKTIKTKNKVSIFFISMLLGGITEYLCSYIQEVVFHTISWDYSYLTFNLNGRTSLLHCTYWGIAGILYISFIEPLTHKIGKIVENKTANIITIMMMIFMLYNASISWIAAERQKDRRENIEPRNKIEEYLDRHYPDEYLDRIFSNKKNM